MSKITVGIDLDNTLVDLVSAWLAVLNAKYGLSYQLSDITDYDMQKAIPQLTYEQIYAPLTDITTFDTVKPLAGAVESLAQLVQDDRFQVYIVTNTHYKVFSEKMERVLFKYFPFLSRKQLICMRDKQLLNIDVLLDDYIGNLSGGSYYKLLYDMPYNKEISAVSSTSILSNEIKNNTIYRIKSLADAYKLLEQIWQATQGS